MSALSQKVLSTSSAATTKEVVGTSFNVDNKKHRRFFKHLKAKTRNNCGSSSGSESKYRPSDMQLLRQNGKYMNQ